MHFGHKTKGLAQSNNPLSHAKPLAQSTTLSHMHSHASQPQNHQETPFTHTCTYSFIIAPPFTHTCTYSFIIAPPIQHMHSHTNNLALFPSLFHPHALSIITTTFTLKQSPTYSPIPPIKTHAFIHKNHISFSYTTHHKHIQSSLIAVSYHSLIIQTPLLIHFHNSPIHSTHQQHPLDLVLRRRGR